MTELMRGGWPRLVVLISLTLFAWTHRDAFWMSGFADDLGVLVDLSKRAGQGGLLADVLAHATQPLWPGSTMWRPLPYASFALDAMLWGAEPGLWRITNLALHLACAIVAGMICRDMTQQMRAGAVGFAVFLLIPWSPEVVMWLAGRFDGWATLAVLLSVWAALKSEGGDRGWLASVVAGAAAYPSKESALILPLWIALIAVFVSYRDGDNDGASPAPLTRLLTDTIKRHGLLLLSHAALAAAYLLWRATLFPTSSLSVYNAAPQMNVFELVLRLGTHLQFPLGLLPLAPIAAGVAIVCYFSALAIALCSSPRIHRSSVVIGGLFIVTVLAAVATYFVTSPGDGDGYRLYYLATLGFAVTAASASVSTTRIAPVVIVALLAALAAWQGQVTDEWRRASLAMKATELAIRRAALAMPSKDYGLVLLPDHLGHVPFARNAQGALPQLAGLSAPQLDVLAQLIVFTPPQIDEWHRLSQEGVVRKITTRGDAPSNPTQYFCFDPRTQTLQAFGFWGSGTLEDWRRKWRESVAAACAPVPVER